MQLRHTRFYSMFVSAALPTLSRLRIATLSDAAREVCCIYDSTAYTAKLIIQHHIAASSLSTLPSLSPCIGPRGNYGRRCRCVNVNNNLGFPGQGPDDGVTVRHNTPVSNIICTSVYQ